MAVEERVGTLEVIVARLDTEVADLDRRVGDLEGMIAMYMLPRPPFSSSTRLSRFPEMPIGLMGNYGYRIEKEADRLVWIIRALEPYLSPFALRLISFSLKAVRNHLIVVSDLLSRAEPDYPKVVEHFIDALKSMNMIIFCIATELAEAKGKGSSHRSPPQITIPKREVAGLLLQMKPESLKEDYAKREAIAHMLRARLEFDPSVQEYMREQGISKEDLEKWAEYWGEKRHDPEEVREVRPEAEPRVVELLRTLPPEFRIERVERVGIIRPRIRVIVSTKASSSSQEKREWGVE